MSKIFGIVNITTDSFSDGGLYLDSKKAIEHALKLAEDGADIIDLGAASSNPDTTDVSVEEEIKSIDVLNITPIDAINIIYELKKKIK